MITAYPLCWPVGYPRTAAPAYSNFGDFSFYQSITNLKREIRLLKAKDLIISSNVPLRFDGSPRSDYKKSNIQDRGIAIYFIYKDKQVVLACDQWKSVEDNLRAITKSVEAMRGLERWGVSEILERSFTGFAALPAAGETTTEHIWQTLGIDKTKDLEKIKKAYKQKVKLAHPDTGGSRELFSELERAYNQAIREAEKK